jgi:hypothetical protein
MHMIQVKDGLTRGLPRRALFRADGSKRTLCRTVRRQCQRASLRYVHPDAINVKTLMQPADERRAIRIDLFHAFGNTAREGMVGARKCLARYGVLEDRRSVPTDKLVPTGASLVRAVWIWSRPVA